jgi:hypothetical protein
VVPLDPDAVPMHAIIALPQFEGIGDVDGMADEEGEEELVEVAVDENEEAQQGEPDPEASTQQMGR